MLLAFPATAHAQIALDVGHNHLHPGAISASGIPEFELNRRLAEEVAPRLEAQHLFVTLIGVDGNVQSLAARTQLADLAGARLLISLHHDSVQSKFLKALKSGRDARVAARFSGFSLFISHDNVDAAASLKCASAVGAALIDAGFHASTYHAEPIANEGYQYADRAHGVFFHDQLAVLHAGHQPALLLEAGVIVNPKEERQLTNDRQRALMAQAIVTGIIQCEASP